MSALPDKGERLKTQVKDLEDALESLSLVTASQPGETLSPLSSSSQSDPRPQTKTTQTMLPATWKIIHQDVVYSLLCFSSEPQKGHGEAQPTPAASQSNPFGRKGGTVFLPSGPPPLQHQASGGALGLELSQGPHGGRATLNMEAGHTRYGASPACFFASPES